MKKFIFPIFLAIITGGIMAYIVFSQYNTTKIKTVFNESEKVKLLQIGVYSSLKSMKESMKDIEYYIYNKDQNMYYVYVGITNNKEVLEKLKNYYSSRWYDIYVKDVIIDNEKFIQILNQYDNLLIKSNDEETLKTVSIKILKKYEELKWLKWKIFP